MKAWDRRGLESLPLKLLIMALMISLAAPAVLGSIDSFERSAARSQLVSEAVRLAGVIEEAGSAGAGNRRLTTVSLPPSLSRFSMAMEIGGERSNASALSIRCSAGGMVFSVIAMDDPPVRMASPDGSTLRLEGGRHELSVDCLEVDGRIAVVLSVV